MIAKTVPVPAAAYCRMSSEQQDKSIEDQKAEITRYADKNGYKVVRWYVDEAISGDDETRESFQRLVTDSRTIRDFDAVLVWAQDRFSRFDMMDAIAYWKTLRDAEVSLVSVTEGPKDWDDLACTLVSVVQQYEANNFLKKLGRNIARGMRSTAEQGFWSCSKPPYGYKIIPDGLNPKRKRLAIDEDRAAIVRTIYEQFAREDISFRSIATRLNAAGHLTSLGNHWQDRAISEILENEVYIGTLIRGARAVGKHVRILGGEYVETKRKDAKTIVQDRSQCIVCENAHPAIIEIGTWQRVHEKLIVKRANDKRAPRVATALSGLCRCGHCGQIVCASAGYMRCMNKIKSLPAETPECEYCVKLDTILDDVVQKIEDEFLSEEQIKRYRQTITDHLKAQRSELDTTEAALKKQIAGLTKKLDKVEARVTEVPEDMLSVFYRQIRELRAEKQAAEAQLGTLGRIAATSAEALGAEAQKIVSELRGIRQALRADDPHLVRAAISAVVDKIELWSKPAPVQTVRRRGRPIKRVLHKIKVFFKSPLCTSGGSLKTAADTSPKLKRAAGLLVA
jgi:DNA invertase Pin-like site-specific DNA recombinase